MADDPIIRIRGLEKTYKSGHKALKGIDLDIKRGEIFALLGPNGAGKTTLIGVICGLVKATGGEVVVCGHDIKTNFREARSAIGLVPQELSTDMFVTVWNTMTFSRGLFGKPSNPALLESLLKELSLWDKKNSKIAALSGGMKRRVLIGKALSHEPLILFLDEPTAGVDVDLRRDMWAMVRRLKERGVTIILTTHYLEEAEEMADRIGVINHGELVLVEDKDTLMSKMGQTEVVIGLKEPLPALSEATPQLKAALDGHKVTLSADGLSLTCVIAGDEGTEAGAALVKRLAVSGLDFRTLQMQPASLEDIFVNLVREPS